MLACHFEFEIYSSSHIALFPRLLVWVLLICCCRRRRRRCSIFYTIFQFNEPLLDKYTKRQFFFFLFIFFSSNFIPFSILSMYACTKWRSRSGYFWSRHGIFTEKEKKTTNERIMYTHTHIHKMKIEEGKRT